MSGVGHLVQSGPLLLAVPVAVAAGAITFLSPCCLPLVPGYLSYITGMSADGVTSPGTPQASAAVPAAAAAGTGEAATGTITELRAAAGTVAAAGTAGTAGTGQAASRGRAVAGTALFVLGFSAVFASEGVAFGGLGEALATHQRGLAQVLGCVIIALGLLFAGAFDRFTFAGRIVRPSVRPRAGLAGAPLLGVLFGIGWTPCIGPTLSAVLVLGMTTGTASRGALLAFVYGLGLGIPFLIVAFAIQRGISLFGFARRNARVITKIGGVMLIAVGLLEVTGTWASAMTWLQVHWVNGYSAPF
jgi:cytochrome c-type biogenesis protein